MSTSVWCRAAWLLPLFSLGVEVDPDSSRTSVSVAVGEGTYALVSRGCNEEILSVEQVSFRSVSGTIDHTFKNGLHAGVKLDRAKLSASTPVFTDGQSTPRVQPGSTISAFSAFIGTEARNLGIDAGVFVQSYTVLPAEHPDRSVLPYLRLRLGRTDRIYLEGGFASTETIYASGGLITYGIGIPMANPRARLWIGQDAIPYDGVGLLGHFTYPITSSLSVLGSLRYSEVNGHVDENSFMLGLRYTME